MSDKIRKKSKPFSQVSNHALRNEKLSLKAKGLYSLIESYINIPNFTLYKNTLLKSCLEKQTAFQSAWNELKKAGYLIQKRYATKDGFEYEYELLDTPYIENPCMENPCMENPTMGKPIYGKHGVYSNNDFNNNDFLNNNKLNNTLVCELEIEFEKFWDLYDKKVDKKATFKRWKKLKQEDKDKIFQTLPDYIKSTPDVKFRKNPTTYLNNESWNDEIVLHEDSKKESSKSSSLFDCL
ncbi:MAG TPA: hypothetical protein VFC68_01400 [Treponemataceae bacterium]|nr:hypothetical protein [Treponemataceae bacterium]